jgi:RNA polymerase sigma-70 factor (ECF subfamily)
MTKTSDIGQGDIPPHNIGPLFRSHARKLRAYAQTKGVSLDEAEDVVQEAFARLQNYGPQKKIQNDIAFLRTIIVNLIRDGFRKKRRAAPELEYDDAIFEVAQPLPDQETTLGAKQSLRHVMRDIGDMPPLTREVFIRHRIERQTYEQIAAATGLTVAVTRRHLRDAIVSLTTARRKRDALEG